MALPVDLVVGGPAPPQVVVIHGGQVVVDEGIGVDVFEGQGSGQGCPAVPPTASAQQARGQGARACP
jgi:hypothetical protein